MKHLKNFEQLHESSNKGDICVVFDGTSAYVIDRYELENSKDQDYAETIEYFDDMDEAQERADEINAEAYPG